MSAVGGNGVDQLPVLHDVDDADIDVADIDSIVVVHCDPAARWKRPALDELAFRVEDGDALVVAVVHKDPALRIQSNAVRQLKLSRLGAFHAADDPDKLPGAGEVHDA